MLSTDWQGVIMGYKKIGMIGGVGPATSIQYYNKIIEGLPQFPVEHIGILSVLTIRGEFGYCTVVSKRQGLC